MRPFEVNLLFMGVKDLPKQLRPSGKAPDHIRDFEGQTLAVDVSIVLHRGVMNVQVSEQFHADPMVAPKLLESYLAQWMKPIVDNGVTMVMVFDGARHPLKARMDTLRSDKHT